MVRDHGAAAEAVLAGKMARPGNTRATQSFYRLIRRELRVLRRIEAAAGSSSTGWLGRLLAALRGRSDRR